MWNILLIDLSSSMYENIDKIKAGYEDLIREQTVNNSTNRITVLSFNSNVKILRDEFFPNVTKLEDADLKTSGLTALLDAIGYIYKMILEDNIYNDVFITVITDGLENSSKKYKYNDLELLKSNIEKRKKLKILYIGSDIHCVNGNIISNHVWKNVSYDGDVLKAMKAASKAFSNDKYEPEDSIEIMEDRVIVPLIKRQKTCVKGYCCSKVCNTS
tara:strand:- start:493 stop:1137 length:645 start_codon:yes stop_codon:yes gene_type:complete